MLKSILSGADCAACRFCCSFRRQSLWETPLFDRAAKETLEQKYPEARFKPAGRESYTLDLLHLYRRDDPAEEAACPFRGERGCVLPPEEKPFDCSIWPLRACRAGGEIRIMLENTCPAISRQPLANVERLVAGGLGETIISRARRNPDLLKEPRPGFTLL